MVSIVKILKFVLVIINVFILSACTGLISQPSGNVPVEEAGTGETTSLIYDDQALEQNDGILDLDSMNANLPVQQQNTIQQQPVIVVLLDDSRQQQQQGQLSKAAATIERAIRLEPSNAILWSRLAQIRLVEGNWQQAYVLANKSNSLARSNKTLLSQNWKTIEQAKLNQGDLAAVEHARLQIKKLLTE
jgi:tetratricopeptide (TPR) repeat protein